MNKKERIKIIKQFENIFTASITFTILYVFSVLLGFGMFSLLAIFKVQGISALLVSLLVSSYFTATMSEEFVKVIKRCENE
jgi:hypothetical protein